MESIINLHIEKLPGGGGIWQRPLRFRVLWLRGEPSPKRLKSLVMSQKNWHNETTQKHSTIPHHPGDMPEGTLRAILKQAGIFPDDFLR